MANDDYVYFPDDETPEYKVFSNFQKVKKLKINGKVYKTTEQYFMEQKALLFGDIAIANQIMNTSSPGAARTLGRKVKDFDKHIWNQNKLTIMKTANLEKYKKNPELLAVLLDTDDKGIAEAAPWDAIWGIGMNANKAKQTPKSAWGQNLLGKILMEVRDELK
jgi:ribA/ribD-fused uncharacterized protein